MASNGWKVHNPSGRKRVVVTKELPGNKWLEILAGAGARIEYGTETRILNEKDIKDAIAEECHGVIGQLTEPWGDTLFAALQQAGGTVYSNYAVGYDNVDVAAATRRGIAVGNTPGVLTEATAEMAVALTISAARRVPEADAFMRGHNYEGWLPTMFLGEMLTRKTVGVIGAGRIGAAYAAMMVKGFTMDLIYFDTTGNPELETTLRDYSTFLTAHGEAPFSVRRATTIEEVLTDADVVSLHPPLNKATRHLIDAQKLDLMKKNAILVNTARGPIINEAALVAHCRKNPQFKAGLDVYEDEPKMKPGLSSLSNVVLVPHIASATRWTRQAMASLAASNVAGILRGWPVSNDPDRVLDFVEGKAPSAAPSIINAEALGLPNASF
ncbi:MAG: NAD(P)-dependent oxidoreductase [Acidobacteriota bacterium]|nr:NAD(P)-dependent oxidoreductase [Acidobacteriota bacterium]